MNEKRIYDLGAVLSVTTGRLLTDMDDIYDVMSFLVGRSLFTHELPTFRKAASNYILSQYPELAGVGETEEFNSQEDCERFIEEKKQEFGETRELSPMVDGKDFNNKSFEEIMAEINKPTVMVDLVEDKYHGAVKPKYVPIVVQPESEDYFATHKPKNAKLRIKSLTKRKK